MKKVIDILQELHPEFDYSESENYVEDGFLDSFDIVFLISAFDKEYNIKIKGVEVVPENFTNINTIENLVKKYKSDYEG